MLLHHRLHGVVVVRGAFRLHVDWRGAVLVGASALMLLMLFVSLLNIDHFVLNHVHYLFLLLLILFLSIII